MGQGVVVRRVTSLAALRSLEPEWAELHESSGSSNPFSAPEWPLLWIERFLRPGDQIRVLEVREDDALVGVVPLVRKSLPGGRARLQSPGMGAPWIGPYELPAPIVARGQGRAVLRAAVENVVSGPRDWDWISFPLGDAAPWFEVDWVAGSGDIPIQQRTVATVILRTNGDGSAEGMGRNLKESVRRARNRLTRAYGTDGWSVRRAQGVDDIRAAFDRLTELHADRADRPDKRHHADVFSDRAVASYVRDVVTSMARRQRASIYELVAGDSVMASQLMLETSCSTYASSSGSTADAWEYSPGTYLLSVAVSDAREAGLAEVNLSAGPNQNKLRWSHEVRSYPEFAVVGGSSTSTRLFQAYSARAAIARVTEARRTHAD